MKPLPWKHQYSVIYADPPWDYNRKVGFGISDDHYACMKQKDIEAMNVKDIAADDCALFLWTTMPMIPKALRVIERWDFTYKTVAFVWVKRTVTGKLVFGLGGACTRSNAELCLFATKGRPKRTANNERQIIEAERREHSRKPDEAYVKIENLFPDARRIELFARAKRDGWDNWGLEVGKFGV